MICPPSHFKNMKIIQKTRSETAALCKRQILKFVFAFSFFAYTRHTGTTLSLATIFDLKVKKGTALLCEKLLDRGISEASDSC